MPSAQSALLYGSETFIDTPRQTGSDIKSPQTVSSGWPRPSASPHNVQSRAETLAAANAALVAAQNAVPLARSWGRGEVASADGLRFAVPVRTIHSGPNPHYFGHERGVTWYNLASDQYIRDSSDCRCGLNDRLPPMS